MKRARHTRFFIHNNNTFDGIRLSPLKGLLLARMGAIWVEIEYIRQELGSFVYLRGLRNVGCPFVDGKFGNAGEDANLISGVDSCQYGDLVPREWNVTTWLHMRNAFDRDSKFHK